MKPLSTTDRPPPPPSPVVSGQEPQIIDFQTQQLKVLPHIAACYVLRAATARLWEHHTHVTSEVRGGDTALLPEVRPSPSPLPPLLVHRPAGCSAVSRLVLPLTVCIMR